MSMECENVTVDYRMQSKIESVRVEVCVQLKFRVQQANNEVGSTLNFLFSSFFLASFLCQTEEKDSFGVDCDKSDSCPVDDSGAILT